MARMLSRLPSLLPGVVLALLAGCADTQPTGTREIVDPTLTRREVGGTDDVLEVCQYMLA